MRVLVTGHRGFIGRHLVRELRDADHHVAGADLMNRHDLLVPGVLAGVLDDVRPDAVIHLAAQVGRENGEYDLRYTISTNAELTAMVARACGERELRVLYASTSEVYGDQGNVHVDESSRCVLPHNLYGLSKRWGEEALRLYVRPELLHIARLSMPYGPGAPPGAGRRALDNVLWQAHHGKRIPIHRGAERSWCWVEDTVRAMRLVLQGPPGIYNVGRDDDPISMLDLALRCCALAGADPDLIDPIDAPAAQTIVKRLSTAKLSLLGWEPTVGLDEGLPQVLDWVKQFDADGTPTTDGAREALS